MKRPRDHTSNNSVSYRSDLNRADVQPHAAIAAFYAEVRSPSLLPRQAMCLYNAVRSGGCMRGLCVGSVDGAAALYVGAALAENVVGKEAGAVLVSQVDPRLLADGGAARLAACGFSGITARVDAAQPDVAALPMLLEKGERFDFAHLDGIHLFDHAMVSFFFLDLLLDVGGCLILEGCGLGAVESLVSCLRANYRHYRFEGYVGAGSGAEGPPQQAIFRKTAKDARKWNEHSAFGRGTRALPFKWIDVPGLPEEEEEEEEAEADVAAVVEGEGEPAPAAAAAVPPPSAAEGEKQGAPLANT